MERGPARIPAGVPCCDRRFPEPDPTHRFIDLRTRDDGQIEVEIHGLVVSGYPGAEHAVGVLPRRRAGQSQLDAEPVLCGAPEPLDAALGLWAARRHPGDGRGLEGLARWVVEPRPAELLRERGEPALASR